MIHLKLTRRMSRLQRTAQVVGCMLFVASIYMYDRFTAINILTRVLLLLTALIVPIVGFWSMRTYLITTPRTTCSLRFGLTSTILLASSFAITFLTLIIDQIAPSDLSRLLLTAAACALLGGIACWHITRFTVRNPDVSVIEWYRVGTFLVIGGAALASLLFWVWP